MQNSVLRYLEETVSKYPNKTAVVDRNGKLSFVELREQALKLAYLIHARLDSRYNPIFVYLPKSRETMVAFMGILYSGNFYTPTDVKFPFEKINGIMNVLQPELIISDNEHKQILVDNGVSEEKILVVEDIQTVDLPQDSFIDEIVDTDAVYVLFTSGSTGVPKGVIISNRSIIDYIDWAKECYQVTCDDNIGNQAPFYFDNSTLDVYLMLSTGATLYIVPEEHFAFPMKLMTYVIENDISTIFWVPSVFINVANKDILSKVDASCLKKILFAGEVMPNKQLNYWRKNIPDALYSNLYGPTEITVDCTYYIVDREFADDEPLPIGVPCRNSAVMILGEDKKLITDANQTGELCVRGSSLALGYWNNPEKTKEVFIQNPFHNRYEEKIYCTGDLVHYNEFGEIMFDGRKDSQIKHMGYRIELGEIETAVLGLQDVEEACVLYDNEAREIVLYYVGKSGIKKTDIRRNLVMKIPKYMVPTQYIEKTDLPKNDNGKIDRKTLMNQYKEK